MATVLITPSQISASEERGAVIGRFQAGEALDMNHPAVYLDDNNLLHPAVASGPIGKAQAIGLICVSPSFYGGETAFKTNDWVSVCVFGPWWGGPGMALKDGETIWVDKTTAGNVVDTAPTTPAYQFSIGRAQGKDTIFVNPGTTNPVSV